MTTPSAFATRIAAVAAIYCFTSTTIHAADRFWITPTTGPFNAVANWSTTDGGPGGASVPVLADVANFTLGNTYSVTFAAAATNTGLDVDNGNVTFELGGSAYTLTTSFAVDIGTVSGQTARLTVKDGSLGVDTLGDNVELAIVAGSTGFLTVSTGGVLGTAALRPELMVARFGTGTLTVNDNGRIDAEKLTVGHFAGSVGTVTITGPNAVVDLSDAIFLGDEGTGTLNVTNGGTLTSALAVSVGDSLGADGTATVSGIGSSWTMGSSAIIGHSGDGTLTISAGGHVSTTGVVAIGNTATGFGTVSVSGDGSRWNLSNQQQIGSNGLGVMTISSGGEVISTSSATLGLASGSEGRVTVTGAGSLWSLANGLVAGSTGTGELTIAAGGEVTSPGLSLGINASGSGTVTITGTGSKLTTTGSVTVANSGTGTMNVSNGAEVRVGGNLAMADPAGSPIGTLNLNGGAVYLAGNFTNGGVFNFTDGLLQVKGNFQPSAAVVTLTVDGSDNGNLPTLDLIGSGSTTNVAALVVGDDLQGQMLLREGRQLNLGSGSINLGAQVGAEGTLSIQSGAQLTTTGNSAVGGLLAGSGGKGTLNIAGGTADLGLLRLFADGTINLGSGTLAVSSLPVLDGQFNWTGGTLRFDSGFSLTSTNVPKLLGLDATLKSGQELTSSAGINVTVQTPLVVNGGVLNPSLLVNQSRLEIQSGSIGAVQNDGLLLGDGTISGAITNGAAGKIRVDAGNTLFLTGAVAPNAGEINLQGGTLDVAGSLTNSATGAISGRGSLYTGGLTNNGPIAFSGGFADIRGDVTNNVGAFVTTGGGGVTTFFDDVVNQGQIRTNAGSRTVIFGGITGNGSYPGTGIVEQLGDTRPGNSPAIVSYGGDLLLGDTSRLFIELGGTTAGSQYDRISVASNVNVDGALNLSLINGFQPQTGNLFDIVLAGALGGQFASMSGQNLGGGVLLNPITTATSLSLLTAMPGDTDLNKSVDFTDLNNLLSHYQLGGFSGVSEWNAGDFNDDHAVTFEDLNTLLTNYGLQAPFAASIAPVPEPGTLVLGCLGLFGLLMAARRRSCRGYSVASHSSPQPWRPKSAHQFLIR